MTDEYRTIETELTSHLDGYLTGEMTTVGHLLSQIQEVISSGRAVSIWQSPWIDRTRSW